jgi:uncharacterized membrane protein YesL
LAGFFGLFDYSKPGPGVDKDEMQKHSFFVFFEIFFRKFWSLISINLLYFVCLLPFPILAFACVYFRVDVLFYICLFLFVATIGPATAGFTYIMRNYAREEHAFLWMDFKDTVKKNFKESLIVSFINSIVFILLFEAIQFYFLNTKISSWYIIPLGLGISCAVIFTFMQYYLYVMLITFKLSIKNLYKNAFLFSFLGFIRNFLLTLAVAISALIFYIIPISLILIPLISLSFLGFLINRVVWKPIKKYMLDPFEKENNSENDNTELEPLFEDMGREKPKKSFLK